MNVEELYHTTINQLKQGKNPTHQFTTEEILVLNENLVNSTTEKHILKVLCLIDYTRTPQAVFEQSLIKILQTASAAEVIICALGVAQKHIIDIHSREGEKCPYEFMQCLRKFLSHENPEVLEWSLRMISLLGGQGLLLKDEIIKSRPSGLIFNKHKKASKQIIDMLLKRWQPPI